MSVRVHIPSRTRCALALRTGQVSKGKRSHLHSGPFVVRAEARCAGSTHQRRQMQYTKPEPRVIRSGAKQIA